MSFCFMHSFLLSMRGFGVLITGSVLMLASCAKSPDQAKVTAEGETIMSFVEWENIKDGCEIDGTEVYTRLGANGQWQKKAQLWDKECVKKGMQEKGYAKAVVFDPDELSEFKKDVCELYDQTTVVMDGKTVERKYGEAFEVCES